MDALLAAPALQQTAASKPSLAGLGREGLRAALAAVGVPEKQLRMRVGQLWSWIYVRGATSFEDMSDVSKELRATLARAYSLARPEIVSRAGVGRRHPQVAAAAAHPRPREARARDRDRLHPRGRPRHAVHLEPGRLHAHLLVLPHRHAAARAQPRAQEIVGQILLARDRIGDWPGASGARSDGGLIPDYATARSPTSC